MNIGIKEKEEKNKRIKRENEKTDQQTKPNQTTKR